MSAEDWAVIEQPQGRGQGQQNTGPVIARDLVLKDGQTITLGEATFKFYVTPGHTPGATSIEYQVRDGGKTYRALSPGGLGMQILRSPRVAVSICNLWLILVQFVGIGSCWNIFIRAFEARAIGNSIAHLFDVRVRWTSLRKVSRAAAQALIPPYWDRRKSTNGSTQ